jgi:hypothetical protein
LKNTSDTVSNEIIQAFVNGNNANYSGGQISEIIKLLFSGSLDISTVNNIFNGTILPAIIKEGFIE